MVETRSQSSKTPVKTRSSASLRTQSPRTSRSRRILKTDAETPRITRSRSRARQRNVEMDMFQYYEFGGPVGVTIIMLFSPCLMYYLWICSAFYNSQLVWRAAGESYWGFLCRLAGHVVEGAFPHVRAWIIYWVFLLVQGVLAVTLPGVYSKGLPLPHKNYERLTYFCNAAWSFYISMIGAIVLHISGIFNMYTLVTEFGPLLSVAILSGIFVSIVAYFYGIYTGNQHRMSGCFVYDLFMGVILNPRIGKYLDLKMFFEVRIPWFILFFISLAVGIKQYEVYGYISPQVCFVIFAHYLYANACAKGEELIVTTWDMAYEKWGFMLIFWNMAGDHQYTKDHVFFEVSSLLVLQGNLDEDNPYSKTSSLHNWLLGYEFPDMLMLLTQEMVYFLTIIVCVATILETLKEGIESFPMTVLRRSKQVSENEEALKYIVNVMEKSGKRLGVLTKDVFKGKFADEWRSVYRSETFEEVDVSSGVAMAMSVKEEEELRCIRMACKASVVLISTYFVDKMSTIIDEEDKVSHSRLAEMVERKLEDDVFLRSKEMKISPDFDPEQLEWCYTPIIQSCGNYDLRPSAVSDDNLLQGDVILCSLGLRYKSYCSNIGRTYMIDPNKSQENYYDFLLLLQKKVLESIKDGVVIKDVYNKAVGLIRMKYPELESKFVRNIGFGIGIEFQDRNLMLNSKNNRVLKDGMTLNLSIGFNDIENPNPQHARNKTYSLLLIDTIRVTKDAPIVYTDNPKSYNDISYYNDDEVSEKESVSKKRPERKASAINSAILKRKTRGENKDVDDSAEQKRRQHQKELAQKKQEEGLNRFSNGNGIQNGIEKPSLKKFESYKRDSQMPSSISNLKIVVDTKNSSIIVPIYGRPVPFHILTLKNASKNDEGEYVYLRLNFLTPGQGVGKKDDMPFDDITASFIRSLTFRSSDTRHISEVFASIQEMKKNVAKREAERKEMADVIEQDNLIEIKNRRPLKLAEVFVRPALDGKRVSGELEIHQNGLRYQSPLRSDHKIDLLFSNIKHLFFQPCDHELIALIHVHLKNPIMVGKRRARDIQFYREASDMQFDETGNKKRKYRYGDDDELELEQEERRRRIALNREFKMFSEKISESNEGRIDVDIPVRELGFTGVPFRSNVLLQPTTECLVHLTDPPFLVITLSDIEIAHLERVQFGLKNFDLVFVFKDFRRPPAHINTIPMSHLDNVKDWLDSVDIAYTEGVLNLNWATIMKTINDDPLAFFEEGGWAFLNNESDEESAESEEEGSEFTASEDEESEEESEYDENASEDESDFEEEDVSDVEDWDELEKKAARDDTKRSRK
ncbi:hypothetical protein PORY_002095 [Pneumocystis oryctolagi]|uniref:Uncharacterized protein n=1 Tax=Pneumocystis oryctolagi TaxID=42067 RepID=A0ACB7CA96_9ASCO|nr:hypothetical protein PORY_002095 [Pneumocystis oryctolagi]